MRIPSKTQYHTINILWKALVKHKNNNKNLNMLFKWDMINSLLFTYRKLFQSEIIGKETGSSQWNPFFESFKREVTKYFHSQPVRIYKLRVCLGVLFLFKKKERSWNPLRVSWIDIQEWSCKLIIKHYVTGKHTSSVFH